MFPGTNHFGIGFGLYLAPKKFKSSFGKLCETGYPPSNSLLLGVTIGTLTVLVVITQKRPSTFFEIAFRQKRYGVNLRVFCP